MASPHGTLSTRLILPFVRVMDRLGKKPLKPSLEDMGLSLAELTSPDRRISHRDAVQLLEECIRVCGRPELGLLAAEAVEPGELEIWEYAMRSQPTVARAFESMSRLFALLHDGSGLEIDDDGHVVTIRWVLQDGLERIPAMTDFGLGLGLVAWRRVLGVEELAVSEICVPHAAPADLEPYMRLFRCPVRFGAPFAGLSVPAVLLDQPMPQADSVLAEILDRNARDRIDNLPKAGLSQAVQELIAEGLSTGAFGARDVAKRLHMSSRTLQRRLEHDGVGFRELVDETRRTLALRHLSRRHVTVNEVAFLLGFATPSAFHKAFKRWTGKTAGAYRAARQ